MSKNTTYSIIYVLIIALVAILSSCGTAKEEKPWEFVFLDEVTHRYDSTTWELVPLSEDEIAEFNNKALGEKSNK